MAWYLAKSLEKLRTQVNTLAPNRSKASDGTIGDTAHAARKSQHNPDADGSVDALDITHDPKNNVDCKKLFEALRLSNDARIQTVIHNKKIFTGHQSKSPFVVRPYTGKNPHDKHLHIDVYDKTQNDAKAWDIASAFLPVLKPVYTDQATVKAVQQKLKDLGYTEVGGVDGYIGDFTRTAIRAFRAANGLPQADYIDDAFLAKLKTAPPRTIDPKRTEATPALVKEKVPEAAAASQTKTIGAAATVGSVIVGTAQAIAPANSYITPLREMATDMPTWVWFAVIAVVALGIFLLARKGEQASVEAFRDGSRR